ncbi:cupin domain-containing protein [Micromonospora echinofusca]|uniref:Cupin domain-containing protein n=1 Tax=Micromonospora echinofusca TaxID=47858 RepID=A0ABS3W1H1_MICEH|nr:cupin domain-containing protein [Micromonospora echinofusca]MBO4210453.1 cupin domain-containing protein [Micromonospora echinofusca]
MNVIDETEARTTTSPGGTMSGLAGPSQGSRELSTWRVRLPVGAVGPVHTIDREQVWMPVSGSLTVTVADRTEVVHAGQALILPADAVRQIRATDAPAEVLVCMVTGGTAALPGSDERHPLPWAR